MANFVAAKSNTKPQKRAVNRKKAFVEWQKCEEYGCKHLTDQACKHDNKEYDKCHKKGHIFYFPDNYTFVNKMKTPEGPAI